MSPHPCRARPPTCPGPRLPSAFSCPPPTPPPGFSPLSRPFPTPPVPSPPGFVLTCCVDLSVPPQLRLLLCHWGRAVVGRIKGKTHIKSIMQLVQDTHRHSVKREGLSQCCRLGWFFFLLQCSGSFSLRVGIGLFMFLDLGPGSGPSSKSQVLCDADLTGSGDREASSSPPPHHPGRLSLPPSISSEQPERTHNRRGSPSPRIRGTDPRLWPRTLFLPLFPSLLTQEALAAGSLGREIHRHFLSLGP